LTIVKAAAARSSTQQKLTDAIILYNLAEDYDTVIAVLNRAVGSSLAQPSASTPSGTAAGTEARSVGFGGEQDIGSLTQGIIDHYQSDASKWGKVSERNRETCLVLLRFKEAFALYEAGRLEQALEVSCRFCIALSVASLDLPTDRLGVAPRPPLGHRVDLAPSLVDRHCLDQPSGRRLPRLGRADRAQLLRHPHRHDELPVQAPPGPEGELVRRRGPAERACFSNPG
jgi:hypothetical protein